MESVYNLYIIISSTWRLWDTWESDIKTPLAEHGFTFNDKIIARTQRFIGKPRGDEIIAFLKENPCQSFVIIDDDSDMGQVKPFLIQTK